MPLKTELVELKDETVLDFLDAMEQQDFSKPVVRQQYKYFKIYFMTGIQKQRHELMLQGFDKLCVEWDEKQDIFKHLKNKKNEQQNRN